MDSQSTNTLFVRGCSLDRNKNKSSSVRSKSPKKLLYKCWKCGKVGNFKKDCRSKSVERGEGYDDVPSTEGETSLEEGGDVYLASSCTHAYHDECLIHSSVSFHMTPHKEWFCEYEKYNGGDVFLGDDSKTRIT
jgi:hypothetical protein